MTNRIAVADRLPETGTLLVMDSDTGKVITQLPAAERSDDIAFDAASKRIYVPGGDGRIFVFKQNSADEYELLAKVTSEPGAKTCLLVPSLARFYVAVSPGDTKAAAKVLIYRVLSYGPNGPWAHESSPVPEGTRSERCRSDGNGGSNDESRGKERRGWLRTFVMTLLLYFVSIGPVAAQEAGGTIIGTVTDPSGAALASANVTIKNVPQVSRAIRQRMKTACTPRPI